jgi:hypothetical protein
VRGRPYIAACKKCNTTGEKIPREIFNLAVRSLDKVKAWIEIRREASASFLQTRNPPNDDAVRFDEIIGTSQIEFLFEHRIPISRLTKSALTITLKDFSFKPASVEDLLFLKPRVRHTWSPAHSTLFGYNIWARFT